MNGEWHLTGSNSSSLSDCNRVGSSWELDEVKPSVCVKTIQPAVRSLILISQVGASLVLQSESNSINLLWGVATIIHKGSLLSSNKADGDILLDRVGENPLLFSDISISHPGCLDGRSLPVSVEASDNVINEGLELLDSHEEDSVVGGSVVEGSFHFGGHVLGVIVVVRSSVLLSAPWVSHLNKFLAIWSNCSSDDSVGVTAHKLLFIDSCTATDSSSDHVLVLIPKSELVEDLIFSKLGRSELNTWHTSEHVDGLGHPTTVHVVVVNVVLRGGLLQDWNPPGTIWRLLSEFWIDRGFCCVDGSW